jgi:hypothetical protein
MPHPLPLATSKFRAGDMSEYHLPRPSLARAPAVKVAHVTYPSLVKCHTKAPATKLPMGMTLPIMTKMGAHPLDTATSLPPVGRG